jgi:hypothetical protein
VGGDAVAAGGGDDVGGAAGVGGREPEQVAGQVGDGQHEQAEGFVFAAVVTASLVPVAGALDRDQAAIEQDCWRVAGPRGGDRDGLQHAGQPGCLCGQHGDHLGDPAAHRVGGDAVTSGQISRALVVP